MGIAGVYSWCKHIRINYLPGHDDTINYVGYGGCYVMVEWYFDDLPGEDSMILIYMEYVVWREIVLAFHLMCNRTDRNGMEFETDATVWDVSELLAWPAW